MRFWDSSALGSVVLEEHESVRARALLREDDGVTVWFYATTELLSATWRHVRAGALTAEKARQVERRLAQLASGWREVGTELDDFREVRDRANDLLRRYPLRTLDAQQLGAALLAVGDKPRRRGFVTRDEDLREAARGEGFVVRFF